VSRQIAWTFYWVLSWDEYNSIDWSDYGFGAGTTRRIGVVGVVASRAIPGLRDLWVQPRPGALQLPL
jgi:hypothetical protein